MKKFFLVIMLVCSTCAIHLKAQVILHADTSSGCGNLRVTFSLLPASANDTINDIKWDFGNGTTVSGNLTPSITYENPGIFDVSVTINGRIAIYEPGFIRLYPVPDPDFFYTDTLDAGNFAFVFRSSGSITESPSFTYDWIFDDGSTASGKNVFHVFDSSGNYRVKLIVSGSPGCSDSAARDIQVNDLLELPNIFTPNGDGINDYFRIRTNGLNTYSFSVYSRSGNLVFRSESPYIFWDGRSVSGQEMHNGIYFYIISQVDGGNKFHTKGYVHLIR